MCRSGAFAKPNGSGTSVVVKQDGAEIRQMRNISNNEVKLRTGQWSRTTGLDGM